MLATTMTVTFLGTSSGGGPSTSRNCSSLVADVLGDGSLWMVDCAEGTLRQFHSQPYSPDRSNLRLPQVKKIFITHMHGRIVPILRNLLFPVPVGQDAAKSLFPYQSSGQHPTIEIYGPAGIRTFIRSILKMTLSRMSDKYVVHELLLPTDSETSCEPEAIHTNEVAGENILCSAEGFWRGVTQGKGSFGPVVVDAGPITHRDPCIGYVFREAVEPFRKIVILGDTCDPSAMTPLCIDPSPSLLIHEAADAYIPQEIDPKAKRSFDVVKEKALARGHSLPEMAGGFAKTIGAQKLVLNHIGGRFPAPNPSEGYRLKSIRSNVIAEIERQASEVWGMGMARAAWDFMRVAVPIPASSSPKGYPTAHNTWETKKSELIPDSPSYASRTQHRGREGWSTRASRNDSFRHNQSQQHGDSNNVDPLQNRNHGTQRR
ncbi:beta-lactamase-like protein [Lentinula aciculospora]|uniref:Beta-lactamase-like protein n=1 Tax=Lentinula aciculospora TaxID=153920 RepID=A0A9W9DVM2_9AGAR|nr:beta-lactamase-like protein [Lentinula aciculospora]